VSHSKANVLLNKSRKNEWGFSVVGLVNGKS
jgi:hypothetical protein